MAVTDEDIRTLAKRLRDRYGNDRRVSWRSFETEARRSLLLLDEAGLLVTPQASSAERSEEGVCRCAPTPSATPAQISEPVFLGVVRASGDWENWDGNQIAAAVDRARRVLRSEGIEVVP